MLRVFMKFMWDTAFTDADLMIDKLSTMLDEFEKIAPAMGEYEYLFDRDDSTFIVMSFTPADQGVVDTEEVIRKYLNPDEVRICVFHCDDFTSETISHVFTEAKESAIKKVDLEKTDISVVLPFDSKKHTIH